MLRYHLGINVFAIWAGSQFLTIWLYLMLFNNFTEDIWGIKESIFKASWIEMVAVRTILAWYMHIVLDPDIK